MGKKKPNSHCEFLKLFINCLKVLGTNLKKHPKWHKEINNSFASVGMISRRTWSRLKHLRDEKSFTDVTLACDGQTCKAHKMVLSACSPYFKALLEENPAKHPIIILKDVPFQHLTAILEFMYAGEVN